MVRLLSRAVSFLGLALLTSCGAEPPKLVEPRDTTTSARPKAAERARAEHPLTPAKIMFVGDFDLARRMGNVYREVTTYPLAAGGVGYVDANHTRVIATIADVKRLEPDQKFRSVCVAKNGKTTFALSEAPNPVLWTADAFDAPLRKVGDLLGQPHPIEGVEDEVWIVTHDKDTLAVTCSTAKTERIAANASYVAEENWAPNVQLVGLTFKQGGPSVCFLRAPAVSPLTWVKLSDSCRIDYRADGSFEIETRPTPPAKAKCQFVIAADGKKIPCSTPVGKTPEWNDRSSEPLQSIQKARFYAPSRAVIATLEGELVPVAADGTADTKNRIGPPTLASCAALLPTEPLFHCTMDGNFDVVVKVAADATIHEELRRPIVQGSADPRPNSPLGNELFSVTADGGVVVGGNCKGVPGNVACVRNANGTWHDVAFSPELIAALNRTAPSTQMLPTADGQLYVGTATMDGLLAGAVHILFFRADKGPATTVDKIPAWVLSSLGNIGGSAASGTDYSLLWTTGDHVRVWPMRRMHPAFHTPEFCRFDVGLDATMDADCIQGKLFTVGRLGLWEKSSGDFYETLDAGQTFRSMSLPKGLVADEDTTCTALGCRIGPYFREGWGG